MNGKTAAAGCQPLSSRWEYLGLFVIAFFIYVLYNQHVPITDPVEANYALTAKEMVLSADWISPRIYGNVWFDKPVLFYWVTAAAFQLFGFSEWAARLAPAVFAAAGLVLLYWFVLKLTYKPIAVFAVAILGTAFEYTVLAKLVITDMVFFFFNCAALSFFYLGYIKMDNTKRWYLGMYSSMALAVLTKGPVGALLPGLVILLFLILRRNWTELRNLVTPAGIILFAVIAMPWYAAMYSLHGNEFMNTFFGVHNYLRATVSEHPADNVSYYYLVVFLLSMLPWSALAVKALVQSFRALRSSSSPLLLFLILWVVTYFGFYSLMATKYLTYTFPLLFPIAILTAIHLDKMLAQNSPAAVICWVGGPFILQLCVYTVVTYRYVEWAGVGITAASVLPLLLGYLRKPQKRNAHNLFTLLCLGQLVCYILLSLFVFPIIAESRSGRDLADHIAGLGMDKIGLYRFYSTSSVFYNGNIAVKLEAADAPFVQPNGSLAWASKYTMPVQSAAAFMLNSSGSLVVVPDKEEKAFLAEMAGFHPQPIMNGKGFNYYFVDNK